MAVKLLEERFPPSTSNASWRVRSGRFECIQGEAGLSGGTLSQRPLGVFSGSISNGSPLETVRIEEVENSVQPAAVMRQLTEPLGLTDLAINYYELEPGDSFAFAYHNHEIQGEVFYIQSGTATFETDDGPVEAGAGEIIRFDREEFQRGWNRGEVPVLALALGVPSSTDDRSSYATVRPAVR